jgi:signal transduction histidine kinase
VALTAAAPANLQLIGYREALRAALVNLALNAIDAAGPGGRVTLRGEDHNRGIRLIVEDDGPGPPTALAAAMHEPFVTGKPEGVGLGLAVAHAVAAAHGGSLSWSRHGDRTRFAIRLPVPTLKPPPGHLQRH